MQELIDTLVRHHRNFGRLLDVAETELKVLENGGQPDYVLLRNVFLYLTRYAVPFHDPAETAMSARLLTKAPKLGTLMHHLREQQQTVRDSGPQFLAELDGIEAGAFVLRAQVGAPGRGYARALRTHMTMEEEELFPAIMRLFDAADWRAVKDASNRRPGRADQHYSLVQQWIVREVGCDCTELAA